MHYLLEAFEHERKANMRFTVLTNPNGFDRRFVDTLATSLFTEVYGLPAKPNHLIIFGWEWHTAEQFKVDMHLPPGTEVEGVVGLENPKLPFRPPI